MLECHRDVMEFSRKLGAHVGDRPATPPADVLQLRMNLIEEEYRELFAAMHTRDLPGIADGALDLTYVLLGTLIACGVDPTPIFKAIHQSNMTKFDGPVRADGKRMKGPNYKHPDIEALLKDQGWDGIA